MLNLHRLLLDGLPGPPHRSGSPTVTRGSQPLRVLGSFVDYLTLKLPFNVDGDVAKELLSTAWLFKIATHRVLSLVKQQQVLPGTRVGWKGMFRGIAYGVVPNERYADGVITLVMGVYESCRALGIDFRSAELGDWLMFQQSSLEYPSRNITLKPNYEFHVTTIRFNGSIDRVVVKPTIPRSYEKLLGAVITKRVGYMGRVVVRDYGVRGNQLWVRGEVQVTIPLDIYYEHMSKHKRNAGKLVGGVDVNTDRINLAIIDEDGELIDHKTFWFSEVAARGFPKHSAWSIIGMRIHELLNYAYHHGVRILFLENPEVLGRLRLMWIRSGDRGHENYNHKVTTFRSTIIEKIALKAPLYSIEVKYVNPKGTTNSTKYDELMKKHGLDRHTTSAYLIALRGLGINKYVHYK